MEVSPRPVTRGLTDKSVSLKIDWLEGTFSEKRDVAYPSTLTRHFKDAHAFHGYTLCKQYADRRLEMINPDRPDMGVHCQWSAEALAECPETEIELLKFQFSAGMRVTRIDLAIDVKNWRLKPSRARKEIKLGQHKTRAKKCLFNDDSAGKGATQYIGQKTSTIFARLYDKAAEMGVHADHTRIELSLRSGRADKAARSVLSNPDFRPLVKGYIDFPQWNTWKMVMGAECTKLPREQTIGATERWLMEVCAPSLARVHVAGGSRNFLHEFLERTAVLIADARARDELDTV